MSLTASGQSCVCAKPDTNCRVRRTTRTSCIFNTCSVRERAAHKVFTRIGEVRRMRLGSEPVVGVMGCVAQLEGPTIFDNSPSVNMVVGTRATDRLPTLIDRALEGERRVIDLDERGETEVWDVAGQRAHLATCRFRSDHRGLQQVLHLLHRSFLTRTRKEPVRD